jgi:O-antigen/teichoic acid export membrane protein
MGNSIIKASFWSILTEIIAKVVTPISFLILTRILSPEDFGIVAIATTLLGFIYVITDMGISKIIIQESGDENYLSKIYNAGFWFNALLGLFLTLLIVVFSVRLAFFFGEPKSASVICAMGIQVVFYSLSAVQNAKKIKSLEFKFLFYLRLITTGIPVAISIPIAFMGGGYWAIVWGQVFASFFSTIALWLSSKWRPSFIIDFGVLKNIISRSIWNTIDQVFMWIPIGLDTFLISKYLSQKDLGFYTTSRTLFTSAIALSLGAVIPVLYSAFSRIKDNEVLFIKSIYFAQKIVFSVAAFLGVFVFIFSDLIEKIFFRGKWLGISSILSYIFLIMGLEYFYSVFAEALRSKGCFKKLAINTIVSVTLTIPVLFISVKYGILFYVIARTGSLFLRHPLVFYYSKKELGIPFVKCVRNNIYVYPCVIVLLITNLFLEYYDYSFLICNFIKLITLMIVFIWFIYKEKEMIIVLKNKIFKKEY